MIDEQGRIREHIKVFVGGEQERDLRASTEGADEIHIICALSGGAGATRSGEGASKQPENRKRRGNSR
jgi:hypothetical protein